MNQENCFKKLITKKSRNWSLQLKLILNQMYKLLLKESEN